MLLRVPLQRSQVELCTFWFGNMVVFSECLGFNLSFSALRGAKLGRKGAGANFASFVTIVCFFCLLMSSFSSFKCDDSCVDHHLAPIWLETRLRCRCRLMKRISCLQQHSSCVFGQFFTHVTFSVSGSLAPGAVFSYASKEAKNRGGLALAA